MQLQAAVGAIHVDVGGAVLGVGGLGQLVAGRDTDDQIAGAGPQRAADEAAALRPPCVRRLGIQFVGDQLRDPFLEALPLVGEREVVGVGANAQLPLGPPALLPTKNMIRTARRRAGGRSWRRLLGQP
jgi:hypothetical protein